MSKPRLRLLLVEDNPGDARLLRELLNEVEPEAFALDLVESLTDAEAAVAADRFDAILLDLSLPDAQGLGTVNRMQSAAPHVPIVVLTGLEDQELAVHAVQAGAQDYLVKGQASGPLLARALRYAVERKRLEEERIRLLEREKEARSEAEAAYARARGATEQRDRVLAMVTHDLRSPLNGITIGASGALRRGEMDEATAGRLAAIQRAAERMDRLLRDLLDASSIDAGQLSIRPGPEEVDALVREATELLDPALGERSLTLEIDVEPGLPKVVADRDRLNQVLTNLLGNAIKFTPEGGTLTVRAEADGPYVRLCVSDTGPGIPEDELETIFDRFLRPRRTGAGNGMGLGLVIARGIVAAHGGRIWVESEPGAGSAFYFTVPVTKPA